MIYVGAGAVVFFGILAYVMFMIFLPEWVGITGKTALKNEADHYGQNETMSSTETSPVADTDSGPTSENKIADPNSTKP